MGLPADGNATKQGAWIWMNAYGEMPGIASDALELDGVMRGSDGRQPEVWFCWGQSYPGNGLRPRR